jgi:hypothetical protein
VDFDLAVDEHEKTHRLKPVLLGLLACRGHSDPIGKSVLFFRNAEEFLHIGFLSRKQLIAFYIAHPGGRVSLGILDDKLQ